MRVHGIEQLKKKDIPLYYRNEYEGFGDLELRSGDRRQIALSFSVEIKPSGEREIAVQLKDRIDYPLLPVISALKDEIRLLEKNGKLR